MEDRRKILIPVGSEPETPHFDAEETLLSARPVVPIAPAGTAHDFNGVHAGTRAPFYRRSAFLALVVVAAVGIGLAAGLSIARYRYLPEDASTATAQPAPAASDTRTATVQTPKSQQAQEAPALPEVKIGQTTTVSDTRTEDNAKTDAPEPAKNSSKAPDSSKEKGVDERDDEVKTPPASPSARRDKKRSNDDDDDEIDDSARRAQRRERRARNRDDETVNFPRRIERAGERINRIREIFEGTQRP